MARELGRSADVVPGQEELARTDGRESADLQADLYDEVGASLLTADGDRSAGGRGRQAELERLLATAASTPLTFEQSHLHWALEGSRHGRTVGLYVPLPQESTLSGRERLIAAGRLILAELQRLGLTEEDLAADFQIWRQDQQPQREA